jgi:acetyl-CoA C-acetyltransferase
MRQRKLGRGVAIVGAGMSRFGAFKEKDSRDLFVEGFLDLQSSVDKGFDVKDIEALYVGNYSSDLFEGQGHTAPLMADWLGLGPIPATRTEDACASGGVALREGIIAIASGLYDVVLVGGVEKMTNLPTERVTDTLATAGDVLYEIPAGFTFPAYYAAIATAYMARYGATPEAFMKVGMKNHLNGSLNSRAQFGASIPQFMERKKASAAKRGKPIPEWADELSFMQDERANPTIAWPMRLFDCSPISDGGASLLLVAEERAKEFTDNPIHVVGTGQASDVALHDRSEVTSLKAAKLAGQMAYEMAGVTSSDINLAEVHDCFTIAEVVATEDLGFFPEGRGYAAAVEGATSRESERPINTSGGLKSKGHPVGASGIGQVVEIYEQLLGRAGDRQIGTQPRLGLAHNVGGTGQTCVVHILERR